MMKTKLMFKAISVVLAAAMLLSFVTLGGQAVYADAGTPPANPSPPELPSLPPSDHAAPKRPSPEQIAQMKARQAEMQRAIAALEPYIVRKQDGTFTFAVDNPCNLAREAGVSPAVLAQLKAGMEQTNELVRKGALVTDDNLNIRPANDRSRLTGDRESGVCTLSGCPGSNFIIYY